MKLLVISGSTKATTHFSDIFSRLRQTLVSNDIHRLIHRRRSANPEPYAVADVTSLSLDQRETLYRHFNGYTSYVVPDGMSGLDARDVIRNLS